MISILLIADQNKRRMQDFFYIKNHETYIQVLHEEVLFVEALKRYVKVVTVKKSFLTQGSLNELERILPDDLFCRVHRSHIISLRHTKQFSTTEVLVGGKQLAIGRLYRNILLKRITVLHSHLETTKIEIKEFLAAR